MDAPPVQYVTTSDGYDIAYTVAGSGLPFLLMPQPFNHQQLAWQGIFREAWMEPLASGFKLVSFDVRGVGMSSRGLPDGHSIESYLPDVEAVIGSLALDRFAIMATYEFWRVAVRYAAQHPGRVQALVLFNPDPPIGPQPGRSHAFDALADSNWENFLFMTSSYAIVSGRPMNTVGQLKTAVEQGDYLKMLRAGMADDALPSLAAVRAPTLIICERPQGVGEDYEMVACARQIAATIPGARLVPIEGMGEAFSSEGSGPSRAIRLIEDFVAHLPEPATPAASVAPEPPGPLSEREREVLRLIAQGKSNPEIAKELFITRNTVQNHVSSILMKTNLNNRAQAAVYAKDHGIV
jgi:DNA-binding NarL/FixJ family response regulator